MSEMVTGGIGWSLLVPEAIKRTIMHTLWVPVNEHLPEEPLDGIHNFDDLPEYLVTIEGATVATVLTYCGNGEWWREGNFYNVVAWMPLPKAYREVDA